MGMTRDEIFAELEKLDKGDSVAEDEFTTAEYYKKLGIDRSKARDILHRLERRGLVSSRLTFRHGRVRVWKLVEQPKPQGGKLKKEMKE